MPAAPVTIPVRADFRHALHTRFFEVDQHGQVHNAYYLVYAEQAITEFLKARQCGDLIKPGADGCVYVIARTTINYLSPLGFDQELSLAVWISRQGRSSLTFSIAICDVQKPDLIAAIAEIVWVYKDTNTGKSTPLNPDLIARLSNDILQAAGSDQR